MTIDGDKFGNATARLMGNFGGLARTTDFTYTLDNLIQTTTGDIVKSRG